MPCKQFSLSHCSTLPSSGAGNWKILLIFQKFSIWHLLCPVTLWLWVWIYSLGVRLFSVLSSSSCLDFWRSVLAWPGMRIITWPSVQDRMPWLPHRRSLVQAINESLGSSTSCQPSESCLEQEAGVYSPHPTGGGPVLQWREWAKKFLYTSSGTSFEICKRIICDGDFL